MLQYLQGSKVNMIITDYCMPGMSGYELLKKIKVFCPSHCTTIIKRDKFKANV